MAETTKWLLSLEKGQRMVAGCCIVISALSITCGKLYFDGKEKDKKIHDNDMECAKLQRESDYKWAIRFSDFQEKIHKESEDFMKQQLEKAQDIKDNAFNIRQKYQLIQKEATNNNMKVKTLVKNEKK